MPDEIDELEIFHSEPIIEWPIEKTEIKPCPFCGAPGEVSSDIIFGDTKWYVGCSGEKCPIVGVKTVMHQRRKDAIKTWNEREGNA